MIERYYTARHYTDPFEKKVYTFCGADASPPTRLASLETGEMTDCPNCRHYLDGLNHPTVMRAYPEYYALYKLVYCEHEL